MALTQQEIEIMDRLSGMSNNISASKQSAAISNDDMFADMDKITGLNNNIENDSISLDEQIKNENPEQYEQWKAKGPIQPFEAALNASKEFNGNYDNVIQRPLQSRRIQPQQPLKSLRLTKSIM